MTATRRQAREWAIQMLTAADLNPVEDVEAMMAAYWQELASLDEEDGGAVVSGKLKRFAEERTAGVLGSLAEIDALLAGLLDNWDLYRLGTV
jgi:transcription termination factor NusB